MATADTGAGGLFNATGNQAIQRWFTNEAEQNADYSYAVARLVSENESDCFDSTKRTKEVVFDVDVFVPKRVASAHVKMQAIKDRIVTLFRRVALTITSWTVSQTFYDGCPANETSDDTLYSVLAFRVTISQ